jgi:mRNA-degrading endonuclease RelE of RelBE toxin-antitoxin system
MLQLKKDFRKVPGIVALKGKKGFYRVRIGCNRLIFREITEGVEIVKIAKRNEKTYSDL